MRRFLPATFKLRERILTALAIALASVAFYFTITANPRAVPGRSIASLFFGTVLFVAIASLDRTFFTALYCFLFTGAVVTSNWISFVISMPWPPAFASLQSGLAAILFGFFLPFAIAVIPVAFAWCITKLVQLLEKYFYR